MKEVDSTDTKEREQQDGSRRGFLRRSLIGATIVAPVGLLAAGGIGSGLAAIGQTSVAHAEQASASQVQFPKQIGIVEAFEEIKRDENAHVVYLQKALKNAGVTPRPKPSFKGLEQRNILEFIELARTFENVGVGAYLMAAPAISSKAYLAAAGSILTIEARHAGFLDVLSNQQLSPNGAFDKPLTQKQIVADVAPFISSLNGGADPAGKLSNDADILNFALLLEYLEAEFYNLNVNKYFG